MERFYRHPEVLRERRKAEAVLEGLFAAYTRYPELLPREVQAKIPEEGLERAVCDYIAGMTDRFALGPTAGSPPKGPHPRQGRGQALSELRERVPAGGREAG